MANDATVWGVHMGAHVSDRPVEGNYVAIGWNEVGDLTKISPTRDAIKDVLTQTYPSKKAGAIPMDAGSIFKFLHAIKEGDYVVYPSKVDRMVNIGQFTGQPYHVSNDADEYNTKRGVKWLAQYPRDKFSQTALNEIGSFLTMFQVRRHANEFLSKIGVTTSAPTTLPSQDDTHDALDELGDDEFTTANATLLADQNAKDFIIKRITSELAGYEFEDLVAHLLECMGYTTRVTSKSSDGGVDVIAHMDPLGFQPPIVKVQCKRITSQTSRPDVDRLLGTLGDGEYGLFVSLGSYARGAVELERNRAKLRLIGGEQFVEWVFEHYANLSPRYRSLIPLKQIFVPDLS